MLKRLDLTHVGPAPDMMLEFGDRLNVLTGDNSLGKTFVLDVAWWALTGTWVGLPAFPRPKAERRTEGPARIDFELAGKAQKNISMSTEFNPSQQTWVRKRGRPAIPGLVVYARADGGFSVWDPARNYWSNAKPDTKNAEESEERHERHRAYHFAATELWHGLTIDGDIVGNGLIRDWLAWQSRSPKVFGFLESVLIKLAPDNELIKTTDNTVRLSPTSALDIPTIRLPYGEVPLVHLSAGMKRIIALAYLIVWTWHEHLMAAKSREDDPAHRLILLIDEIEAHLHPRWQRHILPALIKVTSELSATMPVQVITGTHSPMILASMEPDFLDNVDKLFHFKLGESGEVTVKNVPWLKHGDATGWLISEVFGLGEARSLPAEEALREATALMRTGRASPEDLDRVHAKLARVLPDIDIFWPRWKLFEDRQRGTTR